jgi:hypothetical protein
MTINDRVGVGIERAVQFEEDRYRYDGKGPVPKPGPPVDGLPDVLAALDSEHRCFHALLDTLEQQLRY